MSAAELQDGKHGFNVGDDANTKIIIEKKGNLNNNDSTINLLDANVIYRSMLNPSSPAYRALTPLENITADLNGDHVVNLLDANVIYRSLLNSLSPAYAEIGW